MKRHTFNGVQYNVDLEDTVAYCDEPHPKRPTIYIPVDKYRGKGQRLLYLLVHEACHACNYRASEDGVERTAHDISRFLWRLGYRKIKKTK